MSIKRETNPLIRDKRKSLCESLFSAGDGQLKTL
jgi:hypothetical protein